MTSAEGNLGTDTAHAHSKAVPDPLSGICKDALVLTMDGARPVQTLSAGDQLVTRTQGAVTLRRIEQKVIVTRAVYVIAGSLGHYQPGRDTLIPATQTVHVRDWRAQFFGNRDSMVARAIDLVDGEYVRSIGFLPLTVYHLICDQPQVLYADGMELGTTDMCADRLKTARAL
jgi:hypothetical protein